MDNKNFRCGKPRRLMTLILSPAETLFLHIRQGSWQPSSNGLGRFFGGSQGAKRLNRECPRADAVMRAAVGKECLRLT